MVLGVVLVVLEVVLVVLEVVLVVLVGPGVSYAPAYGGAFSSGEVHNGQMRLAHMTRKPAASEGG